MFRPRGFWQGRSGAVRRPWLDLVGVANSTPSISQTPENLNGQ